MGEYKIFFKQSVEKDLRSIPKKDLKKILLRIELNWYSHSGHLEKSDIENKLIEVRDDNRKKELFKAI